MPECESCETYSKTARFVSDGRMRAILAAVRSPRLFLDRLEGEQRQMFYFINAHRYA